MVEKIQIMCYNVVNSESLSFRTIDCMRKLQFISDWGGEIVNSLKVNMFGAFSISMGDVSVCDTDNRSKKVWSLLAYIIYHRNGTIKAGELQSLLWSDNEREMNSPGALKTLLYRARAELDKLWDGAGKQLILYRNNGYMWNDSFEVEADYDEYGRLEKAIAQNDENFLANSLALLDLYQGEFLSRLNSELWVIPISTYYHNSYMSHLVDVLPLLLEEKRYGEILKFCSVASSLDPFDENIHCYWMRAYIAMGEHKKAVDIYRKLSDRLLSELGVIPSQDTRAIYHDAIKSSNEFAISVEMLQDQLKESNALSGALICEYDFFRVLCHSMSRSVLRNGIAIHLALITMRGKKVSERDTKRWEKLQAGLQDVIRCSLRRGDSAARCSASQFVIMLPRANYENSCMVCERVLKAYYQKHSRLDAELRFDVFPIQVDDKENLRWIDDSLPN